MAFYLQIPGIKGSATDSQHKEWIGFHALHFNTFTSVHVSPGQVHNRSSSKPSISHFVLSKLADNASPKLLEANLGGKVFSKVVIHVCQGAQKPVIEYTLSNVVVCHYDIQASVSVSSTHERLVEQFSLNAIEIEMRYFPQNGTPISTSYDQETAQLG
jgi:type VI secretion system secreted protein Hcp